MVTSPHGNCRRQKTRVTAGKGGWPRRVGQWLAKSVLAQRTVPLSLKHRKPLKGLEHLHIYIRLQHRGQIGRCSQRGYKWTSKEVVPPVSMMGSRGGSQMWRSGQSREVIRRWSQPHLVFGGSLAVHFTNWEDNLASEDDLKFNFVGLETSKGRWQAGIGYVSVQ